MLTLLMLLALNLSSNPVVASNAQAGHFVDIVSVQYDAETNSTWGIIENYNINTVGGGANVHSLQPRSFTGHVSKSAMYNAIGKDNDVKPVQ